MEYVFGLSLIVGWIGAIGWAHQLVIGGMTRYTRWTNLTNLQWTYVYMMMQFIAVLVVAGLYLIFRG